MSLELRGVHQYTKIPGSNSWRLSKVNPYIRLARADADGNSSVVLIQRGAVHTEGGDVLKQKDYPAWFAEELAKCSPAALAEAGWRVPLAKGD